MKILLADDMPMNVELTVKLLTRRGHNVVAVEDGQQAVEQFKSEPFDVILMDVQMPVVDGLQATRMIRKHEAEQPTPSHIPIIARTAN
ncbi:MAG: response regulator, partial [Candidatus Magasanikbacteria bacterium]|nr:response regulator [Candidatus Magasanikbacteria bacterium]